MKDQPLLPSSHAASWTGSIGDDSIAMTMQAEFEHMTLEEAIASGAFDLADEPGMVRIPVTINMMIPHSVLHPPEAPADDPAASAVAPRSGAGRSRRAFGNAPSRVAMQRVMERIRSATPADPRDGASGIVPGVGNARPTAQGLRSAAQDRSGEAAFEHRSRQGCRALAAALDGAPPRVPAGAGDVEHGDRT